MAAPSSGTGTVSSSPAGINCPATCSANFTPGTKVQLTATPASNYFFQGWSGACAGSAGCTVAMSAAEAVTASFTPGETLTVAITGTGAGTVTSNPAGINCPTTCTATFPLNTSVALTATANPNDVFTSWTGACTGSSSCSVTLNGADVVTASFVTGGVTGGTAAFVYVSSAVSGANNSQIEAYTADSTGQLTPVAGSPFAANVVSLAVNDNFLFGTDGTNLYSYTIAADGSIAQADSINVKQYNNPESCSGGPAYLFLDRTGTTLYNLDYLSDCANNTYQSTGIDSGTGKLSYLGATADASPVFQRALFFTGDNKFAFSASCYHWFPEVYGFKRSSDGTLTLATNLGSASQLPSGGSYCTWWASADNANHLAISVTPMDSSTQQQSGSPQLAVYTVDTSGNATTNSTSTNMPSIVGNVVNELAISPSGSFLAVGEDLGLQVFNFNGASPITPLSGLLTSDTIDEVRWDNQNHLYAISTGTGKLYVFTVSAAGAVAASGSPYQIDGAGYLAVLPKS